jgi:hypothetical protein
LYCTAFVPECPAGGAISTQVIQIICVICVLLRCTGETN